MRKGWSKILAAAAGFLFATAAHGADLTGHQRLANGLDVRLMPRSGTAQVATLVLVKTGYALEEPSRLGFSHLLEHLVFAGTEEMEKKALFDEVERLGGYLNGYTRDDYMGYLMVGHRESRRQSRPDTRAEEIFQSLLYEGSSYERTGLGSEKTVASVSREELLGHYRRVYRPNNMILLAAGGVNTEETLTVLRETFGAAEAGARTGYPELPAPLKGRRVYTLRSELPEVRIRIGFNGPDPRYEDAEALDLLGAVLGGNGGRIAKALEGEGFNPRGVSAVLSINAGFSRFVVSADFPSGTDAEEALRKIMEEISFVAGEGPGEGEVTEARDALRAGELVGAEKLHYYLMGKAPWVVSGAPGQGLFVNRWDRFDAGDLREAAGKYLARRPHAALLAVPQGKTEAAEEEKAALRERRVLGNGLTVIAEKRTGSEVFAVNLLTRRRLSMEPTGKAGITDFLHRMLRRGTTSRSKSEIDEELRKAGASLVTAGDPTVPFGDFYTSRMYSFIRAECLEEEAETVVEVIGDMIKNAAFPREEVEKVRARTVDFISFGEAGPGSLANRLLAEKLYGPGPLGSDVLGEKASIGSITREDLEQFREKYFTGRNLIISVVSGREPSESIRLITAYFDTLPQGKRGGLRVAHTKEGETIERSLRKPQGALAAGAVIGEARRDDQPALTVLTGLLNDRLNRELREKEGLAYSVGASLKIAGEVVVFSFEMGTSPEKMEEARSGLRRVLEEVRDMSVAAEELERKINAVVGRLQMRTLSSLNRGFYLALAEHKGVSHTFDEDYRRILLELTAADVEKAARRYLPRELVEVIVR
jgi:zinc protease